jgi:NitT/TauT family transport system permease protein
MMKGLSRNVSIAIAFVLLFALWSGAAYMSRPAEGSGVVLLPGPGAVVKDLYVLFAEESFLIDVLHSLRRIALGLLSAMVPAFILGIWFGTHQRIRETATPLFAFAMYIPPTALVPILILWFGLGLLQQVSLLFIGTFFYLTIMVAATVASTPQTYLEAALTLGARPSQLTWRVIIPNGLPEFIQHMRVMTGIAWTYLTVAEMVAAQTGIGRVIINSQRYFKTGRVLAGVLTIGLLGIATDLLLRGLSRVLCRWKH